MRARALIVAMAVGAAGCSSGGGSAGSTLSTLAGGASGFEVTTPAFDDGHAIPVESTCDGDGVSPRLEWRDVVDEAAVLALVVTDPDAPKGLFVHWTAWNIPVGTRKINAGGPVPGVEGLNSAGGIGWTAPCPPAGDGPHRYVFDMYGLREPLDVESGADAEELIAAMEPLVVASGRVTGTYGR